jgi:hypothetical protein
MISYLDMLEEFFKVICTSCLILIYFGCILSVKLMSVIFLIHIKYLLLFLLLMKGPIRKFHPEPFESQDRH